MSPRQQAMLHSPAAPWLIASLGIWVAAGVYNLGERLLDTLGKKV